MGRPILFLRHNPRRTPSPNHGQAMAQSLHRPNPRTKRQRTHEQTNQTKLPLHVLEPTRRKHVKNRVLPRQHQLHLPNAFPNFPKNAQIVTKQDQEIYQKLLKSQIFNLNSEARLIQNKKENFTEALNILQLELENINITLEHLQLQQAIQILDKFMSYNKMLYMHRKNAIEIDQQTEQFFQIKFIESYQQIYQQLQENPNKQNPLDILDQDLRP